MTYYTVSWMNSVEQICRDHMVVLPAEDVILGHHLFSTKGDICKQIIGDKFSFDFALPQGMVDQYMEDCDYDIRQWFVMAYPDGHTFGVLFPLTQDALLTLNGLHCEAEESGVEL